jgi:hypothetical protein
MTARSAGLREGRPRDLDGAPLHDRDQEVTLADRGCAVAARRHLDHVDEALRQVQLEEEEVAVEDVGAGEAQPAWPADTMTTSVKAARSMRRRPCIGPVYATCEVRRRAPTYAPG